VLTIVHRNIALVQRIERGIGRSKAIRIVRNRTGALQVFHIVPDSNRRIGRTARLPPVNLVPTRVVVHDLLRGPPDRTPSHLDGHGGIQSAWSTDLQPAVLQRDIDSHAPVSIRANVKIGCQVRMRRSGSRLEWSTNNPFRHFRPGNPDPGIGQLICRQ